MPRHVTDEGRRRGLEPSSDGWEAYLIGALADASAAAYLARK